MYELESQSDSQLQVNWPARKLPRRRHPVGRELELNPIPEEKKEEDGNELQILRREHQELIEKYKSLRTELKVTSAAMESLRTDFEEIRGQFDYFINHFRASSFVLETESSVQTK